MEYSKIRFVREIRKYSQDYVSKKLGIPQNTYSTWEENPGRINESYLVKIAELLQVPREDLVSEMPFVINMHANLTNDHIHSEHLYDSESLFEKLVHTLEAQVTLLREQNNLLIKENERLLKMFKPNR
jgi:transcriptional regulator with XRE-family HTH domain